MSFLRSVFPLVIQSNSLPEVTFCHRVMTLLSIHSRVALGAVGYPYPLEAEAEGAEKERDAIPLSKA